MEFHGYPDVFLMQSHGLPDLRNLPTQKKSLGDHETALRVSNTGMLKHVETP